jgi:UMF1 family MFS transporter
VIRAAYRELRTTITHVRQYRHVVIFLIAYWLYIGGVFTVIFMAANFGQRLGFEQTDLVKALMITNFVGFPATFLYGMLGHHFGPRVGLYLALIVYSVTASLAAFMTSINEFYVLAIIIGCVQGGVQGLSRSYYASLIPSKAPGEFFGFYNMVTKFSHVLGPVLVGLAATFSDEPKFVLLALVPLFVFGGLMLAAVKKTGRAP